VKKIFNVFLLILLVLSALIFFRSSALAFDANNLMDDSIFNDYQSMSPISINNFLNQFGSSCISPNNGFSTPDPQGWSTTQNKYTFGSSVSAGQAIYDTSQLYHVNPQVILATLQKEQSIVTGAKGCHYDRPNPADASQLYTCTIGGVSTTCTDACPFSYGGGCMNIAMSYNCPGSCKASSEGFGLQLTLGTWILRFSQERAYGTLTGYPGYEQGDENFWYSGPMTAGWRQRITGGTSDYYDGTYTTLDGTGVTIANGATASLYTYTPFVSGNSSFVTLFEQWFGPTTGPGYSFIDSTGPPSEILPNDVVNVVVHLKNQSGRTWYSDGNVPAGEHPTRLAMLSYQNLPFANPADPAWLGTQNQVKMSEASVADGGTATFQFTLKGPLQQIGNYAIKFAPVLDGVKFYSYIGLEWNTSTPTPNYSFQVTDSSGFTGNMPTNYTDAASFTIKNTGNVMWFNDASKAIGATPLRLLTAKPFYHNSNFYDSGTWIAPNQITMNSTKVGPGGSATFSFNLKTPSTNGTYSDAFGLVLDGAFVFQDISQMNFTINVADYNYSVVSTDIPSTLLAGKKYAAKIVLKNTGFATWYADGSTPPNIHAIRLMTAGYGNNPLADLSDPNWLGSSQIKMTTASVAPGSNGEFDFSFVAPYNSSGYNNDFKLVLDGVWIVPGSIKQNTSIPNKQFAYNAINGTVNPPPSMSKGQVVSVKLVLINNTNFVWYNDDSKPAQFRGGSIRLVNTNPWYRASQFANPSDPAWLGTNTQVKMLTPVVNPGETGEFDFTWRAPNNAGSYRERFAPVLDGYSVFPDIGMEFDTTVQ